MTLIWHRDAACRPGSGARPQDFSPEDRRGRVRLADAVAVAQTWCAGCPVADDCRNWGLSTKPESIVAGGMWFPSSTATDREPVDLFDQETWKPIDWLDVDYEVSSHGRVRSWKAGQGKRGNKSRLLALIPNGYKRLYVAVTLFPNKKSKTIQVHVLVARAFHGPRPDGQEVRHLDGNHRNNRVENLCYGTPIENASDTKRHGRHVKFNHTSCPSGHSFSLENTYINPQGARECRICNRAAVSRWRARRKAAQSNPGSGAAA